MTTDVLVKKLDSFDPDERRTALQALAQQCTPGTPASPEQVNMHAHTFFSYNGYGASPSRIAFEAWQKGWQAVGSCDFDVLDAKEEFIEVCDLLRVRSTVNLETRVFFEEYAEHEINSPGEPGVYYFMGAGFVDDPKAGSFADKQLQSMRSGAEQRNRDMIGRINASLGTFGLDYETDILPLTPSGNATERHICTAFYDKSRATFAGDSWTSFWSEKLGVAADQIAPLADNPMAFSDVCRSKLMKKGGPGYVQPDRDSFPALDDVIRMILDCKAVPMATYLDGFSSGEADMQAILECQTAKGIAALNIIPDRNWNLKDSELAARKIAKLDECVEIATKMNLPINVGTELNKYGQPWIDAFAAAPMAKHAQAFVDGAMTMVGHARLLRFADFSYISDAAKSEYSDIVKRNEFFASVGRLPAPNAAILTQLTEADAGSNLSALADAAAKGAW